MANSDSAESEVILAQAKASATPAWDKERNDVYGPRTKDSGPEAKTSPSAKTQPEAVYAHPTVSSSDLQFMQEKGAVQSGPEAAALRAQVAKQGVDPEQALLAAAKSNRVVGFGDMHGVFGAHTEFLEEEMAKLKAGGVTHLALELPTGNQGFLDSWDKSSQNIIRDEVKGKSSYVDVINAAKAAGIKVVAVDKYSSHGEDDATRDQTMAANIGKILKDPNAKVAFYVGAEHLERGNRDTTNAPSTAQLLRDQKISVATFFPQLPTVDGSLLPVAKDLRKPLSVATAKADLIAGAKEQTRAPYGKWDNVIFFPPGYGMDRVAAELKQVGKAPKSELENAVKNNQVLLMGEMPQLDLYHNDSPHRRFMAAQMPDLKKAGLTDLGVDIAPKYQAVLEQFEKTGKIDRFAMPAGYSSDDFLAVLKAARASGVRLHALGGAETTDLSPRAQLDQLTDAVTGLVKQDPQAKIMVWCNEATVGNYSDLSLAQDFAKRAISSASFASLSEDYLAPDVGAVTQVVTSPTVFKPAQSSRLKEMKNPIGEPIDYFDNVIIYPSITPAKPNK